MYAKDATALKEHVCNRIDSVLNLGFIPHPTTVPHQTAISYETLISYETAIPIKLQFRIKLRKHQTKEASDI